MAMLPDEALKRFEKGLRDAERSDELEPTAMALSTVDADGAPSSRMVLLKSFSPAGFVFYMNRFQIQPEERILESIFGKKFSAYKKRVRRWL